MPDLTEEERELAKKIVIRFRQDAFDDPSIASAEDSRVWPGLLEKLGLDPQEIVRAT